VRVVVTGVAGFIGSSVADALVAGGHHVVGIDAFVPYYPREAKEANLVDLRRSPAFELHELDLARDPADAALRGADAVIHEAAMPGLAQSWVDIDAYAGCNVVATHRLLEAIRRVGVPRLLHASTSSVYGTLAVGDESLPTRPVSPYGATKLAAEHLVLAAVELFGLDASIVRYFSIFGPRQRPDMAYHRFIEAALDDRPIEVYGDGQQTRSNTFITDAVAGTLAALEGAASGEIYNLGGGAAITLEHAIATIGDAVGRSPRIERRDARPGDQRHTAADWSKAARAFGYRPMVEPDAGLRRQVEWHVERRRR
jgi:nucleoside-diphosphate-sugar epimerase